MGLALPHREARALPRFLTPGLMNGKQQGKGREENVCANIWGRG